MNTQTRQLPALSTEHILFLIPLQYAVNKVSKISATKLRIFLALKEHGLVEEDEEGYGIITERGNSVLTQMMRDVNEYIKVALAL